MNPTSVVVLLFCDIVAVASLDVLSENKDKLDQFKKVCTKAHNSIPRFISAMAAFLRSKGITSPLETVPDLVEAVMSLVDPSHDVLIEYKDKLEQYKKEAMTEWGFTGDFYSVAAAEFYKSKMRNILFKMYRKAAFDMPGFRNALAASFRKKGITCPLVTVEDLVYATISLTDPNLDVLSTNRGQIEQYKKEPLVELGFTEKFDSFEAFAFFMAHRKEMYQKAVVEISGFATELTELLRSKGYTPRLETMEDYVFALMFYSLDH